MTKSKRLFYIISGLIMLMLCALTIWNPSVGLDIIVFLYTVFLTLYGLRQLFYYFTMARFMVGGMTILFRGIIFLDMGVVAMSLNDAPRRYVMFYLMVLLVIEGIKELLAAVEQRNMGVQSWGFELIVGLGRIGVAIAGAFHMNSIRMIVIIYTMSLIPLAITQIMRAFRKTEVVYSE